MSGNDESPDETPSKSMSTRGSTPATPPMTRSPKRRPRQLEKEREERLDPDNRPENALVDNTQREFDPDEGFQVPGEEVENGPEIGADRPEGATAPDDE